MSDGPREDAPDLTDASVGEVLPDRPIRVYPALVSTEASALAWAHEGAPDGALVVADFQASARNRAGYVWETRPEASLGFSLVLRPEGLSTHREGWLFTVATAALVDVAGEAATIDWPDEVRIGVRRWAAVNARTEGEDHDITIGILSVLVDDADPPRDELLARIVGAIERRRAMDEEETRAFVAEHCATLGRSVTAHLVPVGPTGQKISGLAVDVKRDGALVLRTRGDQRMAVRPHAVGILEEAL